VQYAKVTVAAMDIPQWQEVETAKLKEIDWPKDAVTADMITETAQAAGKVAVENIYAGEPLNLRRVLDPKQGGVFSLRIPESKRAFTVRVDDVSGVGGFLLPDSRVDVLASRKNLVTGEVARTETIVQNIKVLAIDQEMAKDRSKPIVVRSVTLEMTPKEAEAVFRAVDGGTIQFALRNPTDATVFGKPDIPSQASAPPPQTQVLTEPAPARNAFTIIRGMNPSRGSCDSLGCLEQSK
jgi:pilus assembly protein CpaB